MADLCVGFSPGSRWVNSGGSTLDDDGRCLRSDDAVVAGEVSLWPVGETPVLASVLVVEDDGAIGKGLVDELASRSYAVVWARTGAEALDHAGVSVPDAVLLDLGLPDMDGVQVCRSLRSRTAPNWAARRGSGRSPAARSTWRPSSSP